jgi:DHA2 family multidrug resistance protein
MAVIGLVGFVWQELTTEHPAVNLKIFRYKTFAISTIFTMVAGFGLFTSVFIYPVLVQRINGFTALETGLSLMYPTLFGVVLFPLIGKQLSKGASPIPFMAIGIVLSLIHI